MRWDVRRRNQAERIASAALASFTPRPAAIPPRERSAPAANETPKTQPSIPDRHRRLRQAHRADWVRCRAAFAKKAVACMTAVGSKQTNAPSRILRSLLYPAQQSVFSAHAQSLRHCAVVCLRRRPVSQRCFLLSLPWTWGNFRLKGCPRMVAQNQRLEPCHSRWRKGAQERNLFAGAANFR